MLKITKDEKDWLLQNGFKFGTVLHRTVKNRSYYMTESKRALQCLEEYKNNRIINEKVG